MLIEIKSLVESVSGLNPNQLHLVALGILTDPESIIKSHSAPNGH